MPSFSAPWTEHGPLRVAKHNHALEHADGADFFWLGDTAWHLARVAPAEVDRYLADRSNKGFNVIQVYASQDPSPRFGGKNYAGEIAFVGQGPPFAAVTLNESYWQHIDFIVQQAMAYGLYVALTPAWGMNLDGGERQYFTDPDQHNYELGKLLGERYRHYPNLIWIACAEYQTPYNEPLPQRHRQRLLRMVEGLLAGDQGNHLMTIHPLSRFSSSDDFHDEPWLAFNMIQSHVWQEYIDSLVSGDWQRSPTKPTLSAEGWYENEEPLYIKRVGIQKLTPFDAAWIQRYQAYWSVFFGSMGYSYGHYRLWTMLGEDQEFPDGLLETPGVLLQTALDAPGAATLIHLKSLVATRPARARIPDQSLITLNTQGIDGTLSPNLRCAMRDVERRWAWIYSTRGETIGLAMQQLAASRADAFWYNPHTGFWHLDGSDQVAKKPFAVNIPTGAGAPVHYFAPPGSPQDGNDWVLMVEVASL